MFFAVSGWIKNTDFEGGEEERTTTVVKQLDICIGSIKLSKAWRQWQKYEPS